MTTHRTVDQFDVGEELEPHEFHVSQEFNQRYLDALEDHHPRYVEAGDHGGPLVHPGLLLNQCSTTKSPSHILPDGVATIHAKDEAKFLAPGRVGQTFRVRWKVIDKYLKRGREYSVTECVVVDEDGVEVLRKNMTTTLSGRKRADE